MYASVDLLALVKTEGYTEKLAEVPEAMGTLGLCLSDAGHRDEAIMVGVAIGKFTEKVNGELARRVAASAARRAAAEK